MKIKKLKRLKQWKLVNIRVKIKILPMIWRRKLEVREDSPAVKAGPRDTVLMDIDLVLVKGSRRGAIHGSSKPQKARSD